MHFVGAANVLPAFVLWLAVVGAESVPNNVNYSTEIRLESNELENQTPSEVQKAVCTVNAGDVRASAEAVTTKTLKGVCGSAEMNLAFRELEAKLYGELVEIKALLAALQQQNATQSQQQQTPVLSRLQQAQSQQHAQQPTANQESETERNIPPQVAVQLQPMINQAAESAKKETSVRQMAVPKKSPIATKLKSLPSAGGGAVRRPPLREHEVNQFNNTLLSDRELKVFTYYWKLENFTANVDNGATVESPIFAIKGKTLHIKALFQHLHRDFLYLQLEYAALLKGNRNSILLDTDGGGVGTDGQIFREIASDKMLFKHKISILDQQQQHGKDLVSQEFSNLDVGFLIPFSALLPFVRDNALLIQLFLYL